MIPRDPIARLAEELSVEVRRRRLSLYVAMGDSFTAGKGCEPGGAWPERLVASMRARSPAIELRNLAVEGATSAEVLEQLPEAIELEPDLVTVVCGANDVLRSTRPDPGAYAAHLEVIVGSLLEALPGVRIATATSPERWDFLALGPRTRERVSAGIDAVNRATREIAAAHDIACLDVVGHPGLSEPENFDEDGLHPSPLGHERAARGFAELLRERFGIETSRQGGTT